MKKILIILAASLTFASTAVASPVESDEPAQEQTRSSWGR